MDRYADVVLLDSLDLHNFGENNAWYEWARFNVQADYHMKLDDESYVVVENLLAALEKAPPKGFLGGFGQRHGHNNFKTPDAVTNFTNLHWIRGWAYVMSEDLLNGLGDCSSSKRIYWNQGGHEDMYNAIALRVCGLDQNITYANPE